mgnify:CR=1 FL=1
MRCDITDEETHPVRRTCDSVRTHLLWVFYGVYDGNFSSYVELLIRKRQYGRERVTREIKEVARKDRPKKNREAIARN